MKKEELYETLGNMDERFINEAETVHLKKRRPVWMKWVAAAACLCIVIVSCAGVSSLYKNKKQANAGISIPAVEIPNTADNAETDMIGLVVYNGNVYTQAESYSGSDALAINHLTGKYLGYATGSIDEFSTDEDYENEFASTLEGKVFEVKGYDTDFRICIRNEIEDENGKKQLIIEYLDHLNGIKMKNGSELFEQRLHLSNRVAAVKWQSHEDWDNARGNLQNAQIGNKLWTEFIDQINKGEFVDTWDPESMDESIYDARKQSHLVLTMDDGTVVRLRLLEGGYVGYEPLGWYFVKIPGDVFNKVFDLCRGNE